MLLSLLLSLLLLLTCISYCCKPLCRTCAGCFAFRQSLPIVVLLHCMKRRPKLTQLLANSVCWRDLPGRVTITTTMPSTIMNMRTTIPMITVTMVLIISMMSFMTNNHHEPDDSHTNDHNDHDNATIMTVTAVLGRCEPERPCNRHGIVCHCCLSLLFVIGVCHCCLSLLFVIVVCHCCLSVKLTEMPPTLVICRLQTQLILEVQMTMTMTITTRTITTPRARTTATIMTIPMTSQQ